MKESKQEYESLRNEIIALEEVQRNVWLYMYMIFCSLFVLGLQWSYYLFLVTYVAIIPFQCVYYDYWWSISKISTYIRVFFEEESENMNWETFHVNYIFKNYYNKKRKNIVDRIRFSGFLILGVLSTVFFCGFILKNAYQDKMFSLNIIDGILMLVSFLFLFAVALIDKEHSKKSYTELEDVTIEYKDFILEKYKKKK